MPPLLPVMFVLPMLLGAANAAALELLLAFLPAMLIGTVVAAALEVLSPARVAQPSPNFDDDGHAAPVATAGNGGGRFD